MVLYMLLILDIVNLKYIILVLVWMLYKLHLLVKQMLINVVVVQEERDQGKTIINIYSNILILILLLLFFKKIVLHIDYSQKKHLEMKCF